MSSFSKMGTWPVGYFRAYSSWILRQRREIPRRVETINAEVARIGDVIVYYGTSTLANGTTEKTEQRVGFAVTPGTSLGKLVRAYVGQGGNPLDISPFMKPESTQVVQMNADGSPVVNQQYPHGGVAAPMSAAPNEPYPENGQTGFSGHPGGYVRMDSYIPARQGGRVNPGAYNHDAIVRNMDLMRSWAKQDIDELRRIEWNIIKLCDLREQLIKERDEILVQAFGGALTSVPPFDQTRFNPSLQVQNLIQEMYDLIFGKDANGDANWQASPDVPYLQFALLDLPSEIRDALGC